MAYGPYQQLAYPSQIADAEQLANSPELWRALMQNQSAAPAAGGDQVAMMEERNRLLTRPTDFMGGGSGGGVKAGEAARPYQNVPDSLMGYRRSGQQKGFDDTNYKHTQPVRVTFPDTGDTFDDAIKGMNKTHALERAYRNWPGAIIQPIEQP
jgi:hypothetical protein